MNKVYFIKRSIPLRNSNSNEKACYYNVSGGKWVKSLKKATRFANEEIAQTAVLILRKYFPDIIYTVYNNVDENGNES